MNVGFRKFLGKIGIGKGQSNNQKVDLLQEEPVKSEEVKEEEVEKV